MYLWSRLITIDWIFDTIQFTHGFGHRGAKTLRPAMVGRVDHVGYGPLGVDLTYLSTSGLDVGKSIIEPVRQTFGIVKGGAVRFGEPSPDRDLVVGEGIETTLSIMQALVSCAGSKGLAGRRSQQAASKA